MTQNTRVYVTHAYVDHARGVLERVKRFQTLRAGTTVGAVGRPHASR
jgi:hypothetical protein